MEKGVDENNMRWYELQAVELQVRLMAVIKLII